ncbi:MAG: hypothetical protein KGI54_10485 [Pseudomonadota bacterium]|nr:hypothetical protein [Pseudomonadota bacterium]
MSSMRAKMQIQNIEKFESGNERLVFTAVSKNEAYPEDGSDEDNTYAKFSPSADLEIYIANPALWGKFKEGEKYYVDFTKAPD